MGRIALSFIDFVIDGAAHCDDLNAPSANDSKSMREARQTFESMLEEWTKD